MKKLLSILSALSFALVATVFAAAQNSPAAGEWDVAMNTPGGVRNFKLKLKVEGEKLSGEVGRESGVLPVQGTAKGNDIQFTYTVKYNDNDMALTMTGKVDGDVMKGMVSFGGLAEDEWSAKRATGVAAAAAPSPTAAPAASGGKIDVSGAWNVEVETSAGSGNPTFTLKQDGEKLSGKYKGALGESDLTGSVKGAQIEFSFKVSGQVDGTVVYTGTTDGKTMKGKVALAGIGEGTFTGKKQ